MRTVGLFEAKQKLSELVDRARRGERIGIKRRGKLEAMIVPAPQAIDWQKIFDDFEHIRNSVRRKKGVTNRMLIEEGRRY
jgi:prevent-host-death family protein